ncbi:MULTISPECIES: hypothetical protein [Parachlamydia]|nr:hypothetical protein [Parachlamydia acanthamoebae]
MTKIYRPIIFFILMIFISISAFSYASNDNCSIAKIDGNKIYLKPGLVQIAKNGIFINFEEQLIPINHLEMDEEGVYFDAVKMSSENCWRCGFPLICGFCFNLLFPGKQ